MSQRAAGTVPSVHADRLVLEGLEFHGFHGDLPAERELGQRFGVDVEITTDVTTAAASDALADAVDYVDTIRRVRGVVEGERYNLLEALAVRITDVVLEQPGVDAVRVRVAKQPPVPERIRSAAVVVERSRGGRP